MTMDPELELEAPATPETATEANTEAMDAMTAGYNKQRGIEPEPVVDPVVETEPVAVVEPEPPVPQPPSVDDRITELVAHVLRVEDVSAKAHGKIGELNRTIQALQQRPQQSDGGELSPDVIEALKQAEAVAEEFPDLAGPLVNVMKALSKRASPAAPAAAQPQDIRAMAAQIRTEEALEFLTDEHPDWAEFRTTPDYKAWLASKDKDYQARFVASKNPFFVSKGLTEAKAWRDKAQADAAAAAAAEQKKTERLEGALTPTGEGTGGPSKLPDSAGLAAGYNKVRRLRTAA